MEDDSSNWTDWISSAFKTAGTTYQAYQQQSAAQAAARAQARSSASLAKIIPLAIGGLVLTVVLVLVLGRRS